MQLSNLAFIAVIIGVFYFLVIRPQQKRTRAQQDLIAALTPGDEIVTIGGIYATVTSVDDRVRVALADGTELEVAKQAIASKTAAVAEEDAQEMSADDEGDESSAPEDQAPDEDLTEGETSTEPAE